MPPSPPHPTQHWAGEGRLPGGGSTRTAGGGGGERGHPRADRHIKGLET